MKNCQFAFPLLDLYFGYFEYLKFEIWLSHKAINYVHCNILRSMAQATYSWGKARKPRNCKTLEEWNEILGQT